MERAATAAALDHVDAPLLLLHELWRRVPVHSVKDKQQQQQQHAATRCTYTLHIHKLAKATHAETDRFRRDTYAREKRSIQATNPLWRGSGDDREQPTAGSNSTGWGAARPTSPTASGIPAARPLKTRGERREEVAISRGRQCTSSSAF
ncbi:uncharacterized protein LOC119332403 [Triticum dicoccoides]|uniref:uncharacterized protein LOC119332403 n=1 Tax=Triticum dicoccoides TaxID=85692 RepID=UPI001891BD25|nr:uncharacterized protein LOC119332403 [Triticum dicoccoides]